METCNDRLQSVRHRGPREQPIAPARWLSRAREVIVLTTCDTLSSEATAVAQSKFLFNQRGGCEEPSCGKLEPRRCQQGAAKAVARCASHRADHPRGCAECTTGSSSAGPLQHPNVWSTKIGECHNALLPGINANKGARVNEWNQREAVNTIAGALRLLPRGPAAC